MDQLEKEFQTSEDLGEEYFYKTPFPMDGIPEPVFPKIKISVENYPTIQQAIDACILAGGGTVEIPEGEWYTGPLRLSSRIRLYINHGARVIFSGNPADYLPVVFTRWEGTECYNYTPLIYAIDADDIALCGGGTLVGSGANWWGWKQLQVSGSNAVYDAAAGGIPVEQRIYGTEKDALRPVVMF